MYQKRVFLHILAQFSDIGIPERGSEVSGPFTVFSAPGVFEATHSRFLAFLCRKDDGREGNSSVELASRERRVVSPGSVRPTNAPDKPKRTPAPQNAPDKAYILHRWRFSRTRIETDQTARRSQP